LKAEAWSNDVDWSKLAHPRPSWFAQAKLGILIHWGAYSVPAWAEPTGELGTVDGSRWFRHNPYAEWYWNTIRFDDSPAREHHRQVYDDAPYDDFLDAWNADDFDPASWLQLFSDAGARYVVPVTKHHDGIALWDAPGTGTRNTVHRGPRRDLIGELEAATRRAGLRFGVYYSGGLDWWITDLPVHDLIPGLDIFRSVRKVRPTDAAYAAYAYLHVRDLIDRYRPDLIWNDIEWPDGGKHGHSLGLFELLAHYFAAVPEGVVNDRWGDTYADYLTSEYRAHAENEHGLAWENCRGLGLSFGYNQMEDDRHVLSGRQLVRHLVDIVSRGGNLLLNVGPTAAGAIPEVQRRSLEQLARWMATGTSAIHGSRPLDPGAAMASDEPWVRWTRDDRFAWGIIDVDGAVRIQADLDRVDPASAVDPSGAPIEARPHERGFLIEIPTRIDDLPAVVRFDLR
jgi:alpha-L-fucosidase